MPRATCITFMGSFTDLNTYVNAERTNRFLAAKIKKEETERVIWDVKALGIRAVTHYPTQLYSVVFSWYTPDERKDPDNIAFAKKFILDGIVKAGLLENDGRKQIAQLTDIFYTDPDQPRVEVRFYPIAKP